MSKRKARPAHEVPVDCSKRAMRAIHQDRRLSYPCGDVYHYGHLSARVKSGDTDRRDLRENT